MERMSKVLKTLGDTIWDLPPLILHPFNEQASPALLLENSRAALMLSGLIPNDGSDPEQLQHRILSGRYGELRMLFFLGKDVFRWIGQCIESTHRIPMLEGSGIRRQSFAGMLTSAPPEFVKEKLMGWGVADYYSIFSRAIGLNALFAEPPECGHLCEDFLRHYHRYTESAYRCYMDTDIHREIGPANFRFALYASGEYTRILESQWAD
jgi:hypothetical protein